MIKDWAVGVNKNALKETTWNNFVGFISDKTRSGKVKRRVAHSQTKRIFNVYMNFKVDEYMLFLNWYNTDLNYGLYSFYFPRIDSTDKSTNRVYRFTEDGAPNFSNVSGNVIKASMVWEEV